MSGTRWPGAKRSPFPLRKRGDRGALSLRGFGLRGNGPLQDYVILRIAFPRSPVLSSDHGETLTATNQTKTSDEKPSVRRFRKRSSDGGFRPVAHEAAGEGARKPRGVPYYGAGCRTVPAHLQAVPVVT